MNKSDERKCIDMILSYGMIDGAHHKQWLLDQTLRYILGKSYDDIIENYNSDPDYADWNEGIAP
jgi:hypothetical protein